MMTSRPRTRIPSRPCLEPRGIEGIKLNKPRPSFSYTNPSKPSTSKSLKTPVATKNQFDALGNQGDNLIEDMIVSEVNVVNATHEPADDGEESEVEEVNIEHSTIKVASTPSSV
ncbi:hypothetical protein Tco_1035608, partial [Tanacetum coccineum]